MGATVHNLLEDCLQMDQLRSEPWMSPEACKSNRTEILAIQPDQVCQVGSNAAVLFNI